MSPVRDEKGKQGDQEDTDGPEILRQNMAQQSLLGGEHLDHAHVTFNQTPLWYKIKDFNSDKFNVVFGIQFTLF